MRKVKAAPGARRLIESLRHVGYDCATAIADLIDNSIAANASEVQVQILAQEGARPPAIVIVDDGKGMSTERLIEAMRFGAQQEYSVEDLGKYGLGLKTASLSQCRRLTVASKARRAHGSRPRRHFARWDLDFVDQTDDWDLLLPQEGDLEEWELQELSGDLTADGGTTVLWTGLEEGLPLLSCHNLRQRERFLAELIKEVGAHLRMVFHRFMDGSLMNRRRLRINLCGEELLPWDPFCHLERATRDLDVLRLPVHLTDRSGGEIHGIVTISPHILPREDEFSSTSAWKDASGPKGWNQHQGFYYYRNDRLLQAGGWSYLRAVDEHTKLLRVAVNFPQRLDHAFQLNVTKMRARMPADLRDAVRQAVSKWAARAREHYDRAPRSKPRDAPPTEGPATGAPATGGKRAKDAPLAVSFGGLSFVLSNAPTHTLSVSPGQVPGQLKIVVPQSHPAACIFEDGGGNGDVRRFAVVILTVLEAVYERRIKPESIPLEPIRRAFKRLKL